MGGIDSRYFIYGGIFLTVLFSLIAFAPERKGEKKNPVEELPAKAAKNRVGKGDPRGDTSRIFQQQFNKVQGELNKKR